jgi:hypothetical protein
MVGQVLVFAYVALAWQWGISSQLVGCTKVAQTMDFCLQM